MIGRIYKIIHNQSNAVYVGMTTTSLAKRWGCYRSDYNKEESSNIAIYPLMQQYGIDNFKMILIKEYDVIDKQHLMVYETLWINKLNCVNKIASFNPMTKSQRDRSYYQRNRNKVIAKVREYAAVNKQAIAERSKRYREANNDAIKARKSAQTQCGCGGQYTNSHKSRHFKTPKHINWLATQS